MSDMQHPPRLLQEHEQRYRSLFVHNPDAIFSLDSRPRFTSVNPAGERISGYTAAELLELSPGALVVPEFLERTLGAFRLALTGQPATETAAIVRKDGSQADLELTLVPIIIDGEVTGVFGIAKEITEQRRAEAER